MTALDELRDVERADVLKQGARAGRLTRRADAVEFAYEEEYVHAGGPPVATTLPLSSAPVVTHAPGALPPFFSGLLPEGRRLSALRTAVKTSADDELTLLLAVGGDAGTARSRSDFRIRPPLTSGGLTPLSGACRCSASAPRGRTYRALGRSSDRSERRHPGWV